MVREIKGYEGYYSVDTDGNVYSIRSKRYLVPIKMPSGYLYVHLCNGPGRTKLARLHRLVAETFLDNPNGYPQVNHKNGDKADNRVTNLEWCSQLQNVEHAMRTGLINFAGEDNPSAKLTWAEVKEIRTKYVRGDKQYGSNGLAQEYGVSNVMICKIIRGECWRCQPAQQA